MGLYTPLLKLILRSELLGFLDHALDVFLGETILLIGGRNILGFTTAGSNLARITYMTRSTHFPLLAALAFMIPLASISKVTSILGTPQAARGIPVS